MIKNNRSAFTLAEMMVVMLILTILLAAFAPLMTKKSKVDLSNPWRWASNNSDVYYGIGNSQTALLGKNSKAATDPNAHLFIRSDDRPAVTLGNGNKYVSLYHNSGNDALCFGGTGNDNFNCGKESTSYGYGALSSNTEGEGNVAYGYGALNVNTTGKNNVAVGNGALIRNTSGEHNVAVGYGALLQSTTGKYNTALGADACASVTTGSFKTCIGAGARPFDETGLGSTTNDSREVFIGDNDTTTYIPGNLVVGGSIVVAKHGFINYLWSDSGEGAGAGNNAFRFVTTNNSAVGAITGSVATFYGNYAVSDGTGLPSDKRLKKNIKENNAGLEKIKQLKIFSYVYKNDNKNTPHVGVIAQDLQKIFPDAVTKGADGYLQIRKEDMFYAAINAIKELDKMVQDLVAQVKTIAAQVAEHDKQIKALQKENKELKTKINNLEKRLNAIEKKL